MLDHFRIPPVDATAFKSLYSEMADLFRQSFGDFMRSTRSTRSVKPIDFELSPSEDESLSSFMLASNRGPSVVHEITNRELFATAATVLPNLQTLLTHGEDRSSRSLRSNRSRRRLGSNAGSDVSVTRNNLHWVAQTKRHGVEIKAFDRSTIMHPMAPGASTPLSTPRPLRTPRWYRSRRREPLPPPIPVPHSTRSSISMSMSELAGLGGSQWPHNDPCVAFAATARVDLSCRLTEALDLLFSTHTMQFDATMTTLFGDKKYKRGDLLLTQDLPNGLNRMPGTYDDDGWMEREEEDTLADPTLPSWVGLQSVTVRPKSAVSVPATPLRNQRLCFAALSQHRPETNEAVYAMRTLPPSLRHRLAHTTEFSGGVPDHSGWNEQIAVGYHLAGSYSDLSGHQTKITMCAYVSTAASDALTCSPQAKYIVSLLAAATSELARLMQRRRLGCQAFISAPLDKSVLQEDACRVCTRPFGLLRRTHFCQLCNHLTCRECSRKCEVEPVAKRVRRNRVCFACVARIDASVFDPPVTAQEREEQQLQQAAGFDRSVAGTPTPTAMATAAFMTSSSRMPRTFSIESDTYYAGRDTRSNSEVQTPSTHGSQLADALYSGNPLSRARALETVRRVVEKVADKPQSDGDTSGTDPSSSTSPCSPVDSDVLNKYLEARRRLSSIVSSPTDGCVADGGRTPKTFGGREWSSDRGVSIRPPLGQLGLGWAVRLDKPAMQTPPLLIAEEGDRMPSPLGLVTPRKIA